ncbi:MAG: hypothetical protein WA118_08290 [Carboxydocellales bacterium]
MADLTVLRGRLLVRMPKRTTAELEGWLTEAATYHGYDSMTDVLTKHSNAMLAYAEYLGLRAKAEEHAENASISIPKGVSVNRTSASDNFVKLVETAYNQYRREAIASKLRIPSASITNGNFVRVDGR